MDLSHREALALAHADPLHHHPCAERCNELKRASHAFLDQCSPVVRLTCCAMSASYPVKLLMYSRPQRVSFTPLALTLAERARYSVPSTESKDRDQ